MKPRWLTSKAKPERGDETKLVHAAIELLHRHGYPAWRNNTGVAKHETTDGREFRVAYGHVGMPDIQAIDVRRGGRAVWIEAKVRTRKLTYEQHIFMADMQAAGAQAFVLRDTLDGLIDMVRSGEQGDISDHYPKKLRRRKRGQREGILFKQAESA